MDPEGNKGMTPAQVIEVIGFNGERLEDFSRINGLRLTYIFRESPKKYLYITFNRNERAITKNLYGFSVITLAKYRAVRTDTVNGSTLAEINAAVGFNGVKYSSGTASYPSTYLWSEFSPSSGFRVDFNTSGKAVSKRLDSGLPGILTLEKYNRIRVGSTSGSTTNQVDEIMEWEGYGLRPYTGEVRNRRWAESPGKYIDIDFRGGTAIAARAVGLPGAVTKP